MNDTHPGDAAAPERASGEASVPEPSGAKRDESVLVWHTHRLLLSASLWTFGALLWAYTVVGEWVLNLSLPEPLGFALVLAAYLLAWHSSVRELREQPSQRWRLAVPGFVGITSFAMTVFFVSSLLGSPRPSSTAMLTVGLWFLSALVYWAGRHLSAQGRVKRQAWALAVRAMLWLVAGLGTLVALLSTMSRT